MRRIPERVCLGYLRIAALCATFWENVMTALSHVKLKHRVVASLVIIALSALIYWYTRAESAKMAAELAIAPHLDRLIYGLE
jgi:hypothetical protein